VRHTTVAGMAFAVLLAAQAPAFADTLEQARTSLKNYGFTYCLAQAYPDSKHLDEDLAAASGAYHFMGRGAHFIAQDEETLEISHDPYQATADFIGIAYPKIPAQTQAQGRKNPLMACLTIYNSTEYEDFIQGQDSYINNPEK